MRPGDRFSGTASGTTRIGGYLRSLSWLPKRERMTIQEFGMQGRPVRVLLSLAFAWTIFLWPPVVRTTGVTFGEVSVVWCVLAAWFTAAHWRLYRLASSDWTAFYVLVFGNVAVGAVVSLSLPVLAGRPETPLWIGFAIMACINGAAEAEGSLLLGIFHATAPLGTVPFFLARGYAPERAFAAPAVAAVASAYGYWYLARRREHWRRDRHEREMTLATQRLEESEKERLRLSRDLHDTIGTSLSLVALYGSLAEHHAASNPSETLRLAGTIRDVARGALDSLRDVLQAIPQSPTRLSELAAGLETIFRRAAEPVGTALRVEVVNGSDVIVQGSVRTTIVRVFQEAVHNAIQHGRSRNVSAWLAAAGDRVELMVSDDGEGFDPARARRGTGIDGMRDRARELGGEVTVDSIAGGGARVRLELPLRQEPTP
jgi:signal transduction histidine kinase